MGYCWPQGGDFLLSAIGFDLLLGLSTLLYFFCARGHRTDEYQPAIHPAGNLHFGGRPCPGQPDRQHLHQRNKTIQDSRPGHQTVGGRVAGCGDRLHPVDRISPNSREAATRGTVLSGRSLLLITRCKLAVCTLIRCARRPPVRYEHRQPGDPFASLKPHAR